MEEAEKKRKMATQDPKKKKGGQKKRVVRALEKREPKIVENIKKALFIRGAKSSQTINTLLRDLYMLKKPEALHLTRKNNILPFEDPSTLEFLSRVNDASLFAFGSHSKKRPNNLVLGRMFDHHVLDLIELGVENFKSLDDFKVEASAVGNKPCFMFIGEEFEQKEEFQKFANIMIDIFRGSVVDSINLIGLEHVFVCASFANKLLFRTYRIRLKKSGSKVPRVELEEMGPSFDATIRRTRFASLDLLKEATRVPRQAKPPKVKNIRTDEFATKGTVRMERQELSELPGKRMKALRNKRKSDNPTTESSSTKKPKKEESSEGGDEDSGSEN